MKKLLKYFLLASFCFVFLLANAANIYGAEASLSGPSEVRAGDTISLSLKVTDNGKYGLSGTLVYDSSQVTLSSISTSLSGWKAENNGNEVLVYDDALANPINGTKTVLTIKFKVNSNVKAGTQINIAVDNILTSDGSSDTSIGTASYSKAVAKPLSKNANLASLSVSGATLSPAFKAQTTSYSIGDVEYSTSKLDIKYTTEDSSSTVKIKGNSLSVGKNMVSVVVTAEDGTEKTYKITVNRKQDPNYKASSNANLKSITVSQGMISPAFAADKTNYVVYLPYECAGTKFTASGTADDTKANGVTEGIIDKLAEGTNQTAVVCKAEDGTEKSYALTVVVMPKYEGEVPPIGGISGGENNPSDEPVDDPTEDTSANTETESEKTDVTEENQSDNGGMITILVVLVVIILIGALVYVLFFSNKRKWF